MDFAAAFLTLPKTDAVRRMLQQVRDARVADDLLYLEAWEADPLPGAGAALRVAQIRRANPELAAEVRAEVHRGRPLTPSEREALLAQPQPQAR